MITRRDALGAGSIGLLVAHRSVRGQPASPLRRIGVLSLAYERNPDPAHSQAAFRQGMQDLGWIDGKIRRPSEIEFFNRIDPKRTSASITCCSSEAGFRPIKVLVSADAMRPPEF